MFRRVVKWVDGHKSTISSRRLIRFPLLFHVISLFLMGRALYLYIKKKFWWGCWGRRGNLLPGNGGGGAAEDPPSPRNPGKLPERNYLCYLPADLASWCCDHSFVRWRGSLLFWQGSFGSSAIIHEPWKFICLNFGLILVKHVINSYLMRWVEQFLLVRRLMLGGIDDIAFRMAESGHRFAGFIRRYMTFDLDEANSLSGRWFRLLQWNEDVGRGNNTKERISMT